MGFGLSGLLSRIRRCGSGSDCRNGLKDDDDESGVADVSSAACKEKKNTSIVSKSVLCMYYESERVSTTKMHVCRRMGSF